MALIEANVAAKAEPARVSISGDTLRPHALWDREPDAIVLLGPVGSATDDLSFEPTELWTTATALGDTLGWPLYQAARVAGGWLIRLELSPGQYGLDFIPDRE